MPNNIQYVSVGIIKDKGKILVCKRKSNQKYPNKWEFPGGKQESEESLEDCLYRELKEELNISTIIGKEIVRYDFRDNLKIIFFEVISFKGKLNYSQFEDYKWILPENLKRLDLIDIDMQFAVEKLYASK